MHDLEKPGPIHIIIFLCFEEDITIITPLQPNAQPQQEKDFSAILNSLNDYLLQKFPNKSFAVLLTA